MEQAQWKHQETPFFVLIATQREMHQSKKVNIKTLPRAYTISTNQRVNSKIYHPSMATKQTQQCQTWYLKSHRLIYM